MVIKYDTRHNIMFRKLLNKILDVVRGEHYMSAPTNRTLISINAIGVSKKTEIIVKYKDDGFEVVSHGICTYVHEDIVEVIATLHSHIIAWKKYAEQENAERIKALNTDQVDGGFKCGHPVACLRNKDGQVRCLMCDQDAVIAELQKEMGIKEETILRLKGRK